MLNDFEELHAEVLLIGTSDVQSAAGEALDALHDVGAHMRSYAGGPAQRFQAAFTEDRRGDAITLRVHT